MPRILLPTVLCAFFAMGANDSDRSPYEQCLAQVTERGLVSTLHTLIAQDDSVNLARLLATHAHQVDPLYRDSLLEAAIKRSENVTRVLLQAPGFKVTREVLNSIRNEPLSDGVCQQLWTHRDSLYNQFLRQFGEAKTQALAGPINDEPKLYVIVEDMIRSNNWQQLQQIAQTNPDFFARNGCAKSRDDSFMFWIRRDGFGRMFTRDFTWPADAGDKIPKRLLLTEIARETRNIDALNLLFRMGAKEDPQRKVYPDFLKLVVPPIHQDLADVLMRAMNGGPRFVVN